MSPYTKLLKHEIREISDRFRLDVVDFAPIKQGVANSNYLIGARQGKYILTVYEIEPIRVVHMCQVLMLLESHGFPAPRLHPMDNGEMFAEYLGKPVLIKPYITGQVEEQLDAEKISQVGAALAKLHEVPAPQNLPGTHMHVEKTYPYVLGQEIDREYRKWVEERHCAIVARIPTTLPMGLVHGDLFWDNVLFEKGKFKAILDFENVSHTYKIFDLGMASVGLCTDDTEIKFKNVSALVEGYQRRRPLTKTEKECLQMFIEWAAVLTSTWRFWKYSIDAPEMAPSRKHQQMVDIAKNASLMPKEEFYEAVFCEAQSAN